MQIYFLWYNVAITHYISILDNYFHNYYLQSSIAGSTNTWLKRLEKNIKYLNKRFKPKLENVYKSGESFMF